MTRECFEANKVFYVPNSDCSVFRSTGESIFVNIFRHTIRSECPSKVATHSLETKFQIWIVLSAAHAISSFVFSVDRMPNEASSWLIGLNTNDFIFTPKESNSFILSRISEIFCSCSYCRRWISSMNILGFQKFKCQSSFQNTGFITISHRQCPPQFMLMDQQKYWAKREIDGKF